MFGTNENTEETPQQHDGKKDYAALNWIGTPLFGTVAVMLIIGTLYLTGRIYYITYLSHFGINENGFPLRQDAYLSRGAMIISKSTFARLVAVIFIFFLGSIYIFYYIKYVASKTNDFLKTSNILKINSRLLERLKKNSGELKYIEGPSENLLIFIFYFALLLIITLSLNSISTAMLSGNTESISDEECFNAKSKCNGDRSIYSLVKNNDANAKENILLFSGFLVAQTETRVALYCKHKTVEYELTGYHLEINLSTKKGKDGNSQEDNQAVCLSTMTSPSEETAQSPPHSQPPHSPLKATPSIITHNTLIPQKHL